jgi:hypothetical protein
MLAGKLVQPFSSGAALFGRDDRALLTEWKPAYKRVRLRAGVLTRDPTRYSASCPRPWQPNRRKIFETWPRLHAVRTALGFAAKLVFLRASLR